MKVKLALLDDHKIILDGLKLMLEHEGDLEIVHISTTAKKMHQLLIAQKVDILITDIGMPGEMNGYDLCITLRKEMPQIKLLALSMSEESSMIKKMIDDAGIDGYIIKSAGQEELCMAIRDIYNGKTYFGKDILYKYKQYTKQLEENSIYHLTPRELEIIKCILQYYSNRQIADQLHISESTVESHRKNIYRKTGTKGEAALVKFIQEKGILLQ